MIAPFSLARLPRIEFGAGSINRVPGLAAAYGGRLTFWREGQATVVAMDDCCP